jgi:hypothetical protein
MMAKTTIIVSLIFFGTFCKAQNLQIIVLGGYSNFHNQAGESFLLWKPNFSVGTRIVTSNKSLPLILGFYFEQKGAKKSFENWDYALSYATFNLGLGIKSKDSKNIASIGSYISLLASTKVSTDNTRAIGYAEGDFETFDAGLYLDYSHHLLNIKNFKVGVLLKGTYGFLDNFHDNAVIITTPNSMWTRNVSLNIGLIVSVLKPSE